MLTFAFTAGTWLLSLRRTRKRETLEAFDRLQEQALDLLYKYTNAQVEEIAQQPRTAPYKELSALLARLDHFAVGVNSRIYDFQTMKRLAGRYLLSTYDKLKPLIRKKRTLNTSERHYCELEDMILKLKKGYTKISKEKRL